MTAVELLAHGGHGTSAWVTSLIYVIPIAVFFVWLAFVAIRDRGRPPHSEEL